MQLEFSGRFGTGGGRRRTTSSRSPEDESAEVQATASLVTYGWGMVPVEVRIGETRWKTSPRPKNGGYVVPLKDKVRAAEGIDVGDTVTVGLGIDV